MGSCCPPSRARLASARDVVSLPHVVSALSTTISVHDSVESARLISILTANANRFSWLGRRGGCRGPSDRNRHRSSPWAGRGNEPSLKESPWPAGDWPIGRCVPRGLPSSAATLPSVTRKAGAVALAVLQGTRSGGNYAEKRRCGSLDGRACGEPGVEAWVRPVGGSVLCAQEDKQIDCSGFLTQHGRNGDGRTKIRPGFFTYYHHL
jgi:hypothetical protein